MIGVIYKLGREHGELREVKYDEILKWSCVKIEQGTLSCCIHVQFFFTLQVLVKKYG